MQIKNSESLKFPEECKVCNLFWSTFYHIFKIYKKKMECDKCGRERIHHNGMWLCKKCIPDVSGASSVKSNKSGPFHCRKC